MHRPSPWPAEVVALFAKEWRCELRTRHGLNTLGLFAFTTLVLASVALGPLGSQSNERVTVLPVLLWLILLFAASAGLPRAFVHEEETHTATALRLAGRPLAIFGGKHLYALALILALEGLVVPLFLILMQMPVDRPWIFVAALLAAGYGLATASALIAAITGQAQSRNTLFAVLAFPILLPLVIFAVQLTRISLGGDGSLDSLTAVLLYDGSITAASYWLFPVIWNP